MEHEAIKLNLEQFLEACAKGKFQELCNNIEFWNIKLKRDFGVISNTPKSEYIQRYIEDIERRAYSISQSWENDPNILDLNSPYTDILSQIRALKRIDGNNLKIVKKINKLEQQLAKIKEQMDDIKSEYVTLAYNEMNKAQILRKKFHISRIFRVLDIEPAEFEEIYNLVYNRKRFHAPMESGEMNAILKIVQRYIPGYQYRNFDLIITTSGEKSISYLYFDNDLYLVDRGDYVQLAELLSKFLITEISPKEVSKYYPDLGAVFY